VFLFIFLRSTEPIIAETVTTDNLFTVNLFVIALRQEHRLRLFENRVLRRIFGPE
jgi:hypothetical protein